MSNSLISRLWAWFRHDDIAALARRVAEIEERLGDRVAVGDIVSTTFDEEKHGRRPIEVSLEATRRGLKSLTERVGTLERAVKDGITPDASTLTRLHTVEDKLRDVADIHGLIHTHFERDITPFDERLKLVEELCKLRFPRRP